MQDSNTQKHDLGGDNADNKKFTQRRKRKSNVEKSLKVVMQKFQESSNEDFKRWNKGFFE